MRCRSIVPINAEESLQNSMWREGFKAPTIAKVLRDENLLVTRQGFWDFLKKYEETNPFGSRREGSERKSIKKSRKVDSRMKDDETTVKELQKMLSRDGHKIGKSALWKYRRELGWTRRGSAYCQMIRDAIKAKHFAWAKEVIGDSFSNCIFSDETTVQLKLMERFAAQRLALNQDANQGLIIQ